MKKTSLILGIIIAFVIAIYTIFKFVHPVLVLTLQDVCVFVLVDALASFLMALYLSKSNIGLIIWTIIGASFLPISIVACVLKYNKNNSRKTE